MKRKINNYFLVPVCLVLIGGQTREPAARTHGGQLARIHLASFEVSPGEILQLTIETPRYDRPFSLRIYNHAHESAATSRIQSATPVFMTEIADNDSFDLDLSAGRIERTIATGNDWQPGKYRITVSREGEETVYTQASFLLSTANIFDFLKSRLQSFRDRLASDAKRLQRADPEKSPNIVLYSPANTAIVTAQPAFRWSVVSNAEKYLLTIRHKGKIILQAETNDTSYVLPSDAPGRLEPGAEYFWEIEAKRAFRAPVKSERSADFTILPREFAERIAWLDSSLSDKSLAAPLRIALYEDHRLFESANSILESDSLLSGLTARTDTTDTIRMSQNPGTMQIVRETLIVVAGKESNHEKKANLYWEVARLESVLGDYQAALQHLHLAAQLFSEGNREALYQKVVGEIENLFDAMMVVHEILRP